MSLESPKLATHRPALIGKLARTVALVLALLASRSANAVDQASLTTQIDQHLESSWRSASLPPHQPASDATFLRRVMLDVVTRIPTASQTREFLANTDPQKRAKLIEQLLDSPAHLSEQATFWRKSWMPQTETPQFRSLARPSENWLRDAFAREVPLSEIAEQLLAPAASRFASRSTHEDAPLAFLAASQYRPELIAANASRAFLGINLDCAQCHDHPFSRWTQDEFWQTAAFFVRPDSSAGVAADSMQLTALTIKIPDTDRQVAAKLFTTDELKWPEQLHRDSGREVFASWATSPTNPFFARATANRIWAKYFGRGIVEPLDDLSTENRPTHPQLLDTLEQALVASNFNRRLIIAAILNSRAYQAAATAPRALPGENATPEQIAAAEFPHFTAPALRLLSAEQLDSSLHVAAGIPWERAPESSSYEKSDRETFLDRFQDDATRGAMRSIPQALTLMNGAFIERITDPQTSPTVLAIADSPFMTPADQVESLFLIALSRFPTAAEHQTLAKYLSPTADPPTRRQAISNLLWAILNSSEFQVVP